VAATFETPTGCAIPELTIGTMNEVVVRAELVATQPNCETYCAASARADAEAACGATAAAAACRTDAETKAEASCQTTCVSETKRIVAETALSAEALLQLNARGVSSTSLGELKVDLVFDEIAAASK